MSNFNMTNFVFDGYCLMYRSENGERQFVARFKYRKGSMRKFARFLAKNFTVEEYFERRAKEAPFEIASSKGFAF